MRLDSVLWFLATRLQEYGPEKMLAGTNGAEDLSGFDRLEADFNNGFRTRRKNEQDE